MLEGNNLYKYIHFYDDDDYDDIKIKHNFNLFLYKFYKTTYCINV